MSLLVLSVYLAATPELPSGKPTAPQPGPVQTCSSLSPSEVRMCVSARIQSKERTLTHVLARTRERVARSHADYGHWDNRTAPHFVDRSQAAWASYVEANCTVSAAFGGGSNSAISDRFSACFEEELDSRIRFLRDLSDGTGAVDY